MKLLELLDFWTAGARLASFPGHFLRGRKNGLVYTVRACANYSVKCP